MSKKIFVRLATSDIVLDKEDANKVSGHTVINDKDGNYMTEVEVYSIGFEDEDGNECNEDGSDL